jgi:hypothetical protein
LSTQALADVDADVQVKADLDVGPAIDLPHCAPRYVRLVSSGIGQVIFWSSATFG